VVNANLLACEAEVNAGEFFNIACNERYTLNELYAGLKEIIGADVEPKFAPPRKGDVKHSQAGIDHIQNVLGFEVTVGFKEGLERTVNWYRRSIGDDS